MRAPAVNLSWQVACITQLAALILSLCAAVAQAKAPPRKVANAEAEEHVQRGDELLLEQKYIEAATELQAAYTVESRPLLLFNIAQIYRKAGLSQDALEYYQRFLDAAPSHNLAVEARAYIADMKILIAERERTEKTPQQLQEEQERGELKQKALTEEQKRIGQVQEQLQTERRTKKPLYKRGWFWGAIVGSVATTALAVGLGVGLRPPPRPVTDSGFLDIHF